MSRTPLKLFDGLLMSTEKLVSDLLSGIMLALRILLYWNTAFHIFGSNLTS